MKDKNFLASIFIIAFLIAIIAWAKKPEEQNIQVSNVDTGGITGQEIIDTIAGNTEGGLATEVNLLVPGPMSLDGFGNFYFYEGGRIRKVDNQGIITTVAGGGSAGNVEIDGVLAVNSGISHVRSMEVDSQGNLYFSNISKIRKVDTDGIISLV